MRLIISNVIPLVIIVINIVINDTTLNCLNLSESASDVSSYSEEPPPKHSNLVHSLSRNPLARVIEVILFIWIGPFN